MFTHVMNDDPLLHQSYTGSRDMWGLYDADEDKRRGQSVPIYDDGKIEIIGLESAGRHLLQIV
jgi:hypothetical protein